MKERRRLCVEDVQGEPSYAIAEAARILGRSRPTLMRWAPHLRRYTGHSARQDDGGRWYFPVAAVERLSHDPALMKELGRCANEPDGQLARCIRTLSTLRKQVAQLRQDVSWLKRRVAKTA